MKRLLLLLLGALILSAVLPITSASADIRFWRRHHNNQPKSTEPAKPKPKRSLLHRSKPNREQAAREEVAYGMSGPKSVGFRHPQPGPAGAGAR